MTNPISPEAQQQLQSSIKAIEELGAKLGEIGVRQQKQAVDNANEVVAKIKPITIKFRGVKHEP